MSKFFREPLIQFLVIGALIYVAYALFGSPDQSDTERTVYVNEDRIESLAVAWEKRWNRAPTEQELAGLIRAYVREDIYYREAMAMGLDGDDHIIRRRLAQKLEFLTNDIVQLQEPTEEELQEFFTGNEARFAAPDTITFVQIFFNPDKRGSATVDDAERVLKELQAAGNTDVDPAVAGLGDRLLLDNYYRNASEYEVRRVMGGDFATAVMQLEPGMWHGPVLSGFGTHLVFVYEKNVAPMPALADVRDTVVEAWRREQTEKFNEEFFSSLQDRYDIVIEAPDELVRDVLQPDSGAPEVALPDGEAG